MNNDQLTIISNIKIKRTSQEWQALKPLTVILDPDGWDRGNYQFSWHEEKITELQYNRRLGHSTCMWLKCKPHNTKMCKLCNG